MWPAVTATSLTFIHVHVIATECLAVYGATAMFCNFV